MHTVVKFITSELELSTAQRDLDSLCPNHAISFPVKLTHSPLYLRSTSTHTPAT